MLLFLSSSSVLFLPLAVRGGEGRELRDIESSELGGVRRSTKLQFGEQSMVATDCRRAHRLTKRPVQPPVWRLIRRVQSAFKALLAPSGLVPGGREGCRRWCSVRGGEGQGPDGFSFLLFRVLCARLQAPVVILHLLGSCMQTSVTAQF